MNATPGAGREELALRLDAARRFARSAGLLTLERFGDPNLRVDNKADGSVVTQSDREAEALLRELIRREFPGDAVLGEELGELPGETGFRWILDPIDGTASFARAVPLYGTLVGVEYENSPVVGVVEIPGLNERVFAALGQGAFHQAADQEPTPARVSATRRLDHAMFCTTSYDYFRDGHQELFRTLCNAAASMRGWSDCYAYVLLATGRADAVVEPKVKPWDISAPMIVIAEAGGRATDWRGRPTAHAGTSLATNARIHDELLTLLAGHEDAAGV